MKLAQLFATVCIVAAVLGPVQSKDTKPAPKPAPTTDTEHTPTPPCGECAFGDCAVIKNQKALAVVDKPKPDKDGSLIFASDALRDIDLKTAPGTTTNNKDAERLTLTVEVHKEAGCYVVGLTDTKDPKAVEEYAALSSPKDSADTRCNKVFKLPLATTTKLQVWKLPLDKDTKGCPKGLEPPK